MKAITVVAIAVAMLVVVVPMVSAGGYGGVEVYPNGELFFYAGGSVSGISADVWGTPGVEAAMVVGRDIGPFSPRIGLSVGSDGNGANRVSHTNVKLVINTNVSMIKVKSINLHQNGHGDIKDFTLSRNFLSLVTKKAVEKDEQDELFQIGIVGHNIRFYNPAKDDMDVALFWGLYADAGPVRACVGINVLDGKTLWAALDIGF